jgi:polyisoprenoid-binding protein YceI
MLRFSLLMVLLLLRPFAVSAHHAFAADYDAKDIGTLEGEVIEVFYKNPHAHYYLEVTGDDGSKETWDVQTMNLISLNRLGWKKDTVTIGDKVVINGNFGRNNTKRLNILTLEKEDGTILKPMGGPSRTVELQAGADGKQPSIAAAIAPGAYELDETHAYLSFSYSHMGLSFPKLRFTNFDANLNLDGHNMANSSIDITIDASSLDSTLPDFNEELTGDKFFNVATYPNVLFKSTSYEETSTTTGKLTGDLTVKDITKPVTLDVTINKASENIMSRDDAIGFTATGILSRTDFGLSMMTPTIGDEVSVQIQTEFIKIN